VVNDEHSLSRSQVLEDSSETCDIFHELSKLENNFLTFSPVPHEFEIDERKYNLKVTTGLSFAEKSKFKNLEEVLSETCLENKDLQIC